MSSDTEQLAKRPAWRVEQIESLEHGFGAGIFDCADNEVVSMYASQGWLDAEITANLNLMAAAPALLAALLDIAEAQNTEPDGLRWMAVKASHKAGVGLYPQTFRVIHRGSGTIEDWSLDRILAEINDALIEYPDMEPILATDSWAEWLREWTGWQLIDDPQ